MTQLLEYAESEIELSLPPPGSDTATSTKDHLLQVYKQTGKLPKPLADQPKCPEMLAHLWDWFMELQHGEPLTFCEIQAWSQLTCRNVTAVEANVFKQLDAVKWRVVHGRNLNTRHSRKK